MFIFKENLEHRVIALFAVGTMLSIAILLSNL